MGPEQTSSRTLRVLDLFSGAGGLSAGLASASAAFEVVRAVEYDAAAAATYALNHTEDVVFAGSIQRWLRHEEPPTCDVIIGGPPCQGFSALGKQDMSDERNQLWRHYAETIRRAQPSYFVLENVPQFLTSVQFGEFQQQCQPGHPLSDYTFRAEILNAADFGAPQLRRRVILIGHHRDLPSPGFPTATHARLEDGTHAAWRTVKDALVGLTEEVSAVELPPEKVTLHGREFAGAFVTSDLHLTRRYEAISLERFRSIPPGGNRFDIREDLLPACWRKHRTGSGDVMGRLSYDKPSVTIRTEFFKPEKGRYLHPSQDRALTLHEAARIQGFPDTYRWAGAKVAIARQIGNAVPLPLGRAIGAHLANATGVHAAVPAA